MVLQPRSLNNQVQQGASSGHILGVTEASNRSARSIASNVMCTPRGVHPGNNQTNSNEKTGRYKAMPDYQTQPPLSPPVKLLDQLRGRIRRLGSAKCTEVSYVRWIKRDIVFHGKQHLSLKHKSRQNHIIVEGVYGLLPLLKCRRGFMVGGGLDRRAPQSYPRPPAREARLLRWREGGLRWITRCTRDAGGRQELVRQQESDESDNTGVTRANHVSAPKVRLRAHTDLFVEDVASWP